LSTEPVSWLLIEQGWEVVDSEDGSVGRVEEVVADRDIFSGLVVSSGLLGKPKWVQAEDVAELEEGRVQLSLSGSAVERLPDYEPPAPA
jgi:hypothetical protein